MSNDLGKTKNVLNIRATPVNWKGEQPGEGGAWTAFDSQENAIRAGALININHWKRGSKSVGKLIAEYAPPNENNTAGYAKFVAARLGVQVWERINLQDPAVLEKLILAMIAMETGAIVPLETIKAGIAAAMAYAFGTPT